MEISNLYDDLSITDVQEKAAPVGDSLRVAVTKTSAQSKAAQSATPNLMSFSTDENSIWFSGRKYGVHVFKNLQRLSTSSSSDDVKKALNIDSPQDLESLISEGLNFVSVDTESTDKNLCPCSVRYAAPNSISITYCSAYSSTILTVHISVLSGSSSGFRVDSIEDLINSIPSVNNTLTSTSTSEALSASMGKKLQDEKLSKTEANDTYAKKSGVSYTTDLPDSLVVPQTIGGISKGTKVSDLEGSTISQMFDNLLFPEVQPTIQAPSATISFKDTFSSSGVYEVGATAPTAANFNTSFNRGTCTVISQANKNRAGNLDSGNSFIYYGGNTSTTTFPAKVTLGTMQYNYHAAYAQGDTLVTSKGNKASVTPNPLPAGSVNSSSLTIFGTYPYYCNGQNASSSSGDSNFPTSATPDTKLPLYKWTSTLVGAKFASEAATGTRMQFMYSSRKNVTKVEFYNTISGKWETFSTSNYNAKSGTKTYSVQGTNETYNILTTTGPLSGNVQYRFTMANA